MIPEEVEHAFAGWKVGGGFFESGISVVGLRSGLMIKAYESELTAGCSETDLVSLFVMLAYSLRGPLSYEHAL